ncbi:MAG: hypothetical protein BJ554DRAFT_2838 [Olpidium bornovanus]|uniref:CYTH domain-containing protein n=1 Tax=Olpidium bornovanus TaxID=278681 RepID=A0A8H8DG45_9FUNG|nr:MAG: hypothetical protein BJ554DRAFT_2838 [Olpidium bornovanus]
MMTNEAVLEVEVKLRLPGARAYRAFLRALAAAGGEHVRTELQVTHVLDTAELTLASARTVLRLRESDVRGSAAAAGPGSAACNEEGERKCVLYVKANPVLKGGISRAEEEEAVVTEEVAHKIIADPSAVAQYARRFERWGAPTLPDIFPGERDLMLTCAGRFRTVRHVIAWQGYMLEVDRVVHGDFAADPAPATLWEGLDDDASDDLDGEATVEYEIELETPEPEAAKSVLCVGLIGGKAWCYPGIRIGFCLVFFPFRVRAF